MDTTTAFEGTLGVGDGVGLGEGAGVGEGSGEGLGAGVGDGDGFPEEGGGAGWPTGTVAMALVGTDLPPQPVSVNTQRTKINREEKNNDL